MRVLCTHLDNQWQVKLKRFGVFSFDLFQPLNQPPQEFVAVQKVLLEGRGRGEEAETQS